MTDTPATRLTDLSGNMRGYQALQDEDGGNEDEEVQEEAQEEEQSEEDEDSEPLQSGDLNAWLPGVVNMLAKTQRDLVRKTPDPGDQAKK